jgi:Tfp pilus assembly protein PilF
MAKAQAALDAGDIIAAERLFGNATVVKPASAAAWHGKGRAFFAQKAWEKALRCFSIAVKFDPKHADAWAARARVWSQMGQGEKARADLEALALLDGQHPELARLREELG